MSTQKTAFPGNFRQRLAETAAAQPKVKTGPDDRDWICSYCHIILDHWKPHCRRCLRKRGS